jgi:TFIIF-interacting CTD phosphatase-like protein
MGSKDKNKKDVKSKQKLNNKKYVICDLDETLIHSVEPGEYDKEEIDVKLKMFDVENMDGYYYVFSRPGLQDFLDYLFDNFNVIIWTAASKDYALFIIDQIILKNKKRKIEYVLFSYHCDISKKIKSGIKDLSFLWDVIPEVNEFNTIIIDDNKAVKKTGYCLKIPEFLVMKKDSDKDTYLEDIRDILKDYKAFPDDQVFNTNISI